MDQYIFCYYTNFIYIYFILFITATTCAINELTCLSGMCVSGSARCDGVKDCDDASDELNCAAIGIIFFIFTLLILKFNIYLQEINSYFKVENFTR